MKKNKKYEVINIILVALVVILTIGAMIFAKMQFDFRKEIEQSASEEYTEHYMFIDNGKEEDFFDEMFEGALYIAKENNVYLEDYGRNFIIDYSKAELFEMAIAAKVDGIIIEGDTSTNTTNLINKAVENGITVINTLYDGYGSNRQAFVGIANYDMGMEYAKEVININNFDMEEEVENVLVILEANNSEDNQILTYNGINEVLKRKNKKIKLQKLTVNNKSEYSAEEIIRDMFSTPRRVSEDYDIIIALNEKNTLALVQNLIDYNEVGDVKLIGTGNNEKIKSAIKDGIIYSSIRVNGDELGKEAMRAMIEYKNNGLVNDYMTAKIEIINKENVEKK